MKNIELNTQDVIKKVFKDDWQFIEQKILTNCFCHTCNKARGHYEDATVVDYKVYATRIYDLVFKGVCSECGNELNRLVETSEDMEKKSEISKLLNAPHE